MNIEWDGALAERQDRVFKTLDNVSKADLRALKSNLMVPIASVLAPSNLTVRHYCLLSMLTKRDYHDKIQEQCIKLTNGNSMPWFEGYSYWCYTKYILRAYADIRPEARIWFVKFIEWQDMLFNTIAYLRDGILYPPPFGDLWDEPLNEQDGHTSVPGRIKIYTWAIGFNLHTEFVNKVYNIEYGRPIDADTGEPFQFYKGYKEKYPSFWSEVNELFWRAVSLIARERV
jgi:hypothetical protein